MLRQFICSACSKRTVEYLLAHHEEGGLGMLVKAPFGQKPFVFAVVLLHLAQGPTGLMDARVALRAAWELWNDIVNSSCLTSMTPAQYPSKACHDHCFAIAQGEPVQTFQIEASQAFDHIRFKVGAILV